MTQPRSFKLTQLARKLQRDQTDAERKLWQAIRSNQVFGAKVRRQVPIPPYIVDFCWESAKLVVEVDGSQHMENVVADEKRTLFLSRRGYKVVRFDNIEVLTNLDGVFEVIGEEVRDRT
jgi:very-short-patch-repair endonuclease